MAERHRNQLVIALGEGQQGEALRSLFDEAAERAGLPVTTWARRVLQAACGEPHEETVTRTEFVALTIRVRRLETLQRI